MLDDPRGVDLRADMLMTLARARHTAGALAHEGQEVAPPAPEPGSSAALPAVRSTGGAAPHSAPLGRRVVLSPEPGSAAAQVLAALMGSDTDTDGLKPALARLTAHNREILDTGTGTDTLLTALASQLCILETLWQRYTLEAVRATDTHYTKVPLHKIAFAALQAYQRTAVLIASALDARKIVSTTGGDDA